MLGAMPDRFARFRNALSGLVLSPTLPSGRGAVISSLMEIDVTVCLCKIDAFARRFAVDILTRM